MLSNDAHSQNLAGPGWRGRWRRPWRRRWESGSSATGQRNHRGTRMPWRRASVAARTTWSWWSGLPDIAGHLIQLILSPIFLSYLASSDKASNICPALDGGRPLPHRRGVRQPARNADGALRAVHRGGRERGHQGGPGRQMLLATS